MRKLLLIAATASAFAVPVVAHAQISAPPATDDREVVRSLPSPAEIEVTTQAIDRVLGAVLDVDIGPVVDAMDPRGRGRDEPRERTLGELAGRDDPYFEDRMRGTLYGVTAGMGRMVDAVAVLTPVLRQSLAVVGRDIADAVRDARDRRGPPDDRDRR